MYEKGGKRHEMPAHHKLEAYIDEYIVAAGIRDDGKGFVGAHSANDTLFSWPEFGDMIGGYFDDHPWDVFDAPVVVEAPDFPAMKGFPLRFTIRDEIYQVKNFSREKVRVLARLDPDKLDLNNKRVHRKDRDFPVAWVRDYGKGRVFYSTFGHSDESWDRPDVQTMYREAVKWTMASPKVQPRLAQLLEPQLAHKSGEPPLVSQEIKTRIARKIVQLEESLRPGARQQLECLVPVTQLELDQSELERGNIPCPRPFFEFSQNAPRLVFTAGLGEHVPQFSACAGAVGR